MFKKIMLQRYDFQIYNLYIILLKYNITIL